VERLAEQAAEADGDCVSERRVVAVRLPRHEDLARTVGSACAIRQRGHALADQRRQPRAVMDAVHGRALAHEVGRETRVEPARGGVAQHHRLPHPAAIALDHVASASDIVNALGGPGQLPTLGSHRSVRAEVGIESRRTHR
jgi:hypothetical protein